MGFWSWLTSSPPGGETPNANPPSDVGPNWRPGDPRQVMLDPYGPPVVNRGLPVLQPSPWSGWPAEWSTSFDMYGARLGTLVETAWTAIDMNASILSSLPMYRMKGGQAIGPVSWMTDPAPGRYASWAEFAKQLFWDYQMGEVFVFAASRNSTGYPQALMRVPPYLVGYEGGEYRITGIDGFAQSDLLHIRYARNDSSWRGCGPLEAAGARVTASSLIDRYQSDYLVSGGIPRITLETDRPLTTAQVQQQQAEWRASRGGASSVDPAILTGGVKMNSIQQPSVRDAMLLELSQWNEARIAMTCGVPPFLMSLPTGDHMTYRNVEMLLDFHFRGSLWPKANAVMSALSNWALPYGQSVEVNGDQYVRADQLSRAQAYAAMFAIVDENGNRAITVPEIRAMERFGGDGSADVTTAVTGATDTTAATVLTGGEQ